MRFISLKVTALLFALVFATTACANEAFPTSVPEEPSGTAAPAPTTVPTATGRQADPTPEVKDKVEYGGIEVPHGFGVLEIQITSRATVGVNAIVVTVSNLEVQKADAFEEEGWISLFEDPFTSVSTDPKTFDLIEVGRDEKVLGFNLLPIGNYSEVRMEVDSVEITTQSEGAGATTKIAELPGEQLKIVRKINIEDQIKAFLTMDFDVSKVLVSTGGGDFRFEPIFRLKGRSQDLAPAAEGYH